MAEMPQSWAAYARLQHNLSKITSIDYAEPLEMALNAILERDYSVLATTDADFQRIVDSAGRQVRHRARLRRQYQGDLATGVGETESEGEDDVEPGGMTVHGWGLDGSVHARRELVRLESRLADKDFTLLLAVGAGMSYGELARQSQESSGALRVRVARLRRTIRANTGVQAG